MESYKGNYMNYTNAILLANKATLVGCTFGSSQKLYSFKTTEDLKIDDYVVVQVAQSQSSPFGFAVVKVKALNVEADYENDINYKWVISKVPTEAFADLLEKEKNFVGALRTKAAEHKKSQVSSKLGLDLNEIIKMADKF